MREKGKEGNEEGRGGGERKKFILCALRCCWTILNSISDIELLKREMKRNNGRRREERKRTERNTTKGEIEREGDREKEWKRECGGRKRGKEKKEK